ALDERVRAVLRPRPTRRRRPTAGRSAPARASVNRGLLRAGQDLPQPVDWNREDDGVAHRLDHRDRQLERAGVEDAAVGPESVRNVLAQPDLERLHTPSVTVDEQRGELTDHEAIRSDHGSTTKILV